MCIITQNKSRAFLLLNFIPQGQKFNEGGSFPSVSF